MAELDSMCSWWKAGKQQSFKSKHLKPSAAAEFAMFAKPEAEAKQGDVYSNVSRHPFHHQSSQKRNVCDTFTLFD